MHMHVLCMYDVYTMNALCIYHVYTMHMPLATLTHYACAYQVQQHSSMAECVAALRAEGIESLVATTPQSQGTVPLYGSGSGGGGGIGGSSANGGSGGNGGGGGGAGGGGAGGGGAAECAWALRPVSSAPYSTLVLAARHLRPGLCPTKST